MHETLLYVLTIAGSLIVGLFTVLGFFGVRTLKQIDENQRNLASQFKGVYLRVDKLEGDFNYLKGQHDVFAPSHSK